MSTKYESEFNQLYAQHKVKLAGIAGRELKDKDRAADVVQDVFSTLYENMIDENPIQNMASWLVGVTLNKIRELRRKEKRYTFPDNKNGDEEEENTSFFDLLKDKHLLVDNEMYHSWIKEKIELAIEELPEEQKWVFIQHEIEEKSFKELEEESGVALKTLLSRKHYAVKALKKKLEELYIEFVSQ